MNRTEHPRLAPPAPLPDLTTERDEAVSWFSGMWHGIGLGVLIGAAAVYLLALDASTAPTACKTLSTLQHP